MSYIFNRINLIVVVVMILLIGMSMNEVAKYAKGLNLSNQAAYAQWFMSHKTVFTTQEECQSHSGFVCNYEECDYIPNGETVNKICGNDTTKGWRPTVVAIPDAFKTLTSLQLAIGPAKARLLFEINTQNNTITLNSNDPKISGGKTKTIKVHDQTILTNNMISYDFLRTAAALSAKPAIDNAKSSYAITLVSEQKDGNGSRSVKYTAACLPAECPRTLLDLKNDIVSLWGEPIVEPSA